MISPRVNTLFSFDLVEGMSADFPSTRLTHRKARKAELLPIQLRKE